MTVIAVTNSKTANAYSMKVLSLSFLINFLMTEPKAGQGAIDKGHIINAVLAMNSVAAMRFESFGENPEAAMLEIVQAFGFTS
jgi:hypothetical protein